ncbi:TPA: hypothetical protein N0F65_006496 [Lagenidium giganteum]|uniref:Fanconi anemia group M protein n=1 Tax=Lagenidium giganteum TaxID=4803 RepID=A0AAV2YQT7_9STRA|nr:TPA: hypothetical protein N0F65_006496 [Lagenidium giganteum]
MKLTQVPRGAFWTRNRRTKRCRRRAMEDDDEWDAALLSELEQLESRHRQQQAAQHEQPAAAAWSCLSCTLRNDAARTTCQVCRTPRGQTFTAAPATTMAMATTMPMTMPMTQLSQSKKVKQATLPFARPPPSATAAAAASRALPPRPVPTQAAHPPPRANAAGTAATHSFSAHAADAEAFEPGRGRNASQSRGGNAAAWPIGFGAQFQRGEDEDAKKRYLDVAHRASLPQIDYEAAHEFVYQTNYAVRDYQLTITERALYHNTLVSLPTGLGKTLIASVVMYNYYRWFPTGKIVFMAPTKPLVAQQVKACHEIMGIPLTDTAELQGNVPPSTRRVLWKAKRVFFCTPQSIQNDLRQGICEAEQFVCLVVDEAHRATGNYAYCGVIQEIEKKTTFFRVLALSATPGAKFDIIQDVIRNLRISHIESRCADDPDVKKYTHARQEEVIKCSLSSQITEVKELFLKVFERIVHRLYTAKIILFKDPDKLTRWYVLQMRERFRKSPNYQEHRGAESDLALLVSLVHARDLLTVHGISSFKEYVHPWINENTRSWSKRELLGTTEFQSLLLSLEAHNSNANGNTSSHPKLVKLREVLSEHFERHRSGGSSTRAIVFTQFRASVTEIVGLLERMQPLIKVQPFIGQGASGKGKEAKGQSQKMQQEIVAKFRRGEFNVLVATCIAEEGLDIGEVDLIVSFDALTSPVRMIQRMGRTGRKRVGKVIILVTEGDEEKKLARSVAAAKTVSRALTTFKNKFVYSKCPRMLPMSISPTLAKLAMHIPEFRASQVAGKQIAARQRSSRFGDPAITEVSGQWKLTPLESSTLEAIYCPPGFGSSPRRNVRVSASRTRIVRRNTFLIGHSQRSNALAHVIRAVRGEGFDQSMMLPRDHDELDEPRLQSDVVTDPTTMEAMVRTNSSRPDDVSFTPTENLFSFEIEVPNYEFVDETRSQAKPPEASLTERECINLDKEQTPNPTNLSKEFPATSTHVEKSPEKSVEVVAGESPPSQHIQLVEKSRTQMSKKPRKKLQLVPEEETLESDSSKSKPTPMGAVKDASPPHLDRLLERGNQLIKQLESLAEAKKASSPTSPDAVQLPTDKDVVSDCWPRLPRCQKKLDFSSQSSIPNHNQPESDFSENCVPLPPTIPTTTPVQPICGETACQIQNTDVLNSNAPVEETKPIQVPETSHVLDLSEAHAPSPSGLLLTQSQEQSTKKLRRLRRLKRRRISSQCSTPDGISQPRQPTPKKAKSKMDTQAAARLFIDDEAEVSGEDEDDDMDGSSCDEFESSFIDDGSQMVFSNSVMDDPTFRPSPGDMRAIYARSLMESQETPQFFRGRRASAYIPTGGIIRDCLRKMKSRRAELEEPTQTPVRSIPEEREEDEEPELPPSNGEVISLITPTPPIAQHKRSSAPANVDTVVITRNLALEMVDEEESDDDDFEKPESARATQLKRHDDHASKPSNPTMNNSRDSVSNDNAKRTMVITSDTQRPEQPSIPINVAERAKSGAPATSSGVPSIARKSTAIDHVSKQRVPVVAVPNAPCRSEQPFVAAIDVSKAGVDAHPSPGRSARERAEANRRKALERLQARAAQAQTTARPPPQAHVVVQTASRPPPQAPVEVQTISRPPPQAPLPIHDDRNSRINHLNGAIVDTLAIDMPSFNLLGPTGPEPIQEALIQPRDQPSGPSIRVSSSFSSTTMCSAVGVEARVVVESKLEVDVVLGLRVGVMWISGEKLEKLGREAAGGDAVQHRQIQMMNGIFKQLVIVVETEAPCCEAPVVDENSRNGITVLRTNSAMAAVSRLLVMARREIDEGYGLTPSTSSAVDAALWSRLEFFLSIPPISFGSALSLSFRFQNFAARQVPAKKFNQMHWRRMLPWISADCAQQIYDCFAQLH